MNVSRDGRRILYQEIKSFENEWRKHHTSSASRDLLEYDFDKKTYRFVARHDGEDRDPVYSPTGKSFYFLSERNGGSMNVYEATSLAPPPKPRHSPSSRVTPCASSPAQPTACSASAMPVRSTPSSLAAVSSAYPSASPRIRHPTKSYTSR